MKKETTHLKDPKKETWEWIRAILIAVILAVLVKTFVFTLARVDGPSMQPTLYTNERVYIDKLTYRFSAPKRGDVVACFYDITGHSWNSKTYIKRIIGLGGETIAVQGGQIYINGKLYDDPYYDGKLPDDFDTISIPKDCVFVMGDNRTNSEDSRDLAYVGPVKKSYIRGRALSVLWPLNKIHTIK